LFSLGEVALATSLSGVPCRVRVSLGSAVVLGLAVGRVDAKPTAAYLLTYWEGRCLANCGFCPQARESLSRTDLLSRVIWPAFPTEEVACAIRRAWSDGRLQRACIQTVNYPGVLEDTLALVKLIEGGGGIPVSVSCPPFSRQRMELLAQAGVERVTIPLDAATESLFKHVKGEAGGGPYTWRSHMLGLMEALSVFGRGRVGTHLIVGLGENDRELLELVQRLVDIGVYPSLFAFTPILGTRYGGLPQPSLKRYRRLQLAHYLITCGLGNIGDMMFDLSGALVSFGVKEDLLRRIVRTGLPFMTRGCPGCNRPYYNERPGGCLYNYPVRPSPSDVAIIEEEVFGGVLNG
jgi:biotin synthase